MSKSRTCGSKWDLKDEHQYSLENVQDIAWSVKASVSSHERESEHGSFSPEVGRNGNKWSVMKSKHGSPSKEYLHGSRGSVDNDKINSDYAKNGKTTTLSYGDDTYSKKKSPTLDERRQKNCHNSPKGDWSRSQRSRSRSCSRSRSRSPAHGIRRQSGIHERIRNGSGVSTQMCRDFMGGRCRRGSQCHFLHQDIQSHENGCDDRQKRAGVSKYITRNDDKDYLVKSGRSTYCCTDYLKGNCRRGASCRFTHGDVSEGYSRGSINEINKERENKRNRVTAPERGVEREARKSSDIPCKYFAAGNCRNGNYCRFSHHGLDKLQDGAKPTDVDTSFNAERSWNASKGSDADVLNDATKPWTGPKWSDTGAYLGATKLNDDINEKVGASKPNGVVDSNDDMEMSPQWNYRIHSSVNKEKSHSSEATHVGTFLPSHEKNITEMASGQACDELSASQRMSTEKSNYQVDRLTMGSTSAALPCDGNAVSRNSSVSHIDPKFSTNILPTQNFDDPGPSLSSLPRSNLNVIGQSELSIPSNEVNTEVLQNSVLFQEEKPCTELHIGDKNILHGNCGSLATSNMVTSCAHSGGPAEPDSMPTVQPGQEISFPKQYDPRADSIDPAKKQDTNTKPLGFSVHSVSQEATKENGVLKIKKAEAENKNGLSENMEADDRNEEGKKRNDGKGLRAFKFALVEFVKDLLKPAWKEGQIGKEAYKSIVKKVVDKVIATMQGTNIPTTPEKIDQYLSFSKPKLSKLVQAYVEKFQKS